MATDVSRGGRTWICPPEKEELPLENMGAIVCKAALSAAAGPEARDEEQVDQGLPLWGPGARLSFSSTQPLLLHFPDNGLALTRETASERPNVTGRPRPNG